MDDDVQRYVTRPEEAFWDGYTHRVGPINMGCVRFEAWNYWLPKTVGEPIRKMAEYFKSLIAGTNGLPLARRRRQHFFELTDTAVGVLHKLNHMMSYGRGVLVGDQEVCPVAWASFGQDQSRARHQFFDGEELVLHYAEEYAGKGSEYGPVTLFHTEEVGRVQLETTAERIGCGNNHAMLGSLMLLHDLLRHGGPDTHELFTLYTNDGNAGPWDVNREHWRWARHRMLGEQLRPDVATLPRPLPMVVAKPTKWKPEPVRVVVQEVSEGDGLEPERFHKMCQRLDWEAEDERHSYWSER